MVAVGLAEQSVVLLAFETSELDEAVTWHHGRR